jgi:hypothetical protein
MVDQFGHALGTDGKRGGQPTSSLRATQKTISQPTSNKKLTLGGGSAAVALALRFGMKRFRERRGRLYRVIACILFFVIKSSSQR